MNPRVYRITGGWHPREAEWWRTKALALKRAAQIRKQLRNKHRFLSSRHFGINIETHALEAAYGECIHGCLPEDSPP